MVWRTIDKCAETGQTTVVTTYANRKPAALIILLSRTVILWYELSHTVFSVQISVRDSLILC